VSRESTSPSRNHRTLLRYMEILGTGDPTDLPEVLAPDYVQVIPQSREILRGVDGFAHVMRNWPADTLPHPDVVAAQVVAPEGHDLVTANTGGPFPTYNVIRIEGEGDTLTYYALIRYQNGDEWFLFAIATFRDGRIVKEIYFFAPMFEPPQWRLQWAHLMTPQEQEELVGIVRS
jgi:hypothetical protein